MTDRTSEGDAPSQDRATDRTLGDVAASSRDDRPVDLKPPANEAAWLVVKRGAIEVRPAPYTRPRADEIVVRNRAVSINPLDWITQSLGDIFFPWIRYPFVLGSDVAGDVVEVGTAVSRFKVGDRVLGHAVGLDKTRNSAAEGAFQTYAILRETMASPIPDAMPYENAAVLPLGLSTAACGLFQADQLALRHPSTPPTPTGKTLLIWGGTTSVGCNAIQLAVAAGYEVITTASPRNVEVLKRLGAQQVFDYRSKAVVTDIIRAFEGRTCAGALALAAGSADACLDIVHACQGDKVVVMASAPIAFNGAPRGRRRALWLVPAFARLAASIARVALKARARRIRTASIFSTAIMDNEVGPMIYADFLPQALADGRYVATPDPVVFGRGLGQIQAALEVQKQGVSASKVVVVL